MRFQKSIRFFSGLQVLLLAAVTFVSAQETSVRVVNSDASGMTIEITAHWDKPLTGLSAASASPGQMEAFWMATAQGYGSVSEPVSLPAPVLPAVSEVASDFDEVFIGTDPDPWPDALRPTLEVTSVGIERKKPAGTLVARLVSYSPLSGTVRRYRRIVARIVYRENRQTSVKSLANPHLAVTNSVLQSGTWFKFPVSATGIHRIDTAYLQRLGLSGTALDVNRIQVFGNGGRPLPAQNLTARIPDLAPIPVFVSGGALYFFAEAASGWTFDTKENKWNHYINPFSADNVYFIRVNGTQDRLVESVAWPEFSAPTLLSTVTGRFFMEQDLENISADAGSGLDWLGSRVLSSGRTVIDQTFPDMVAGTVTYRSRVAVQADPAAPFVFTSTTGDLRSVLTRATDVLDIPRVMAVPAVVEFTDTARPGANQSLRAELRGATNNPQAWIDWVEMFYPKNLVASDNLLRFQSPVGTTGSLEFRLTGFTQAPLVWNISDPLAPRQVAIRSDGNTYRVQVTVPEGGEPVDFIAWVPGGPAVNTPADATPVANQNLHGLVQEPELVIVSPSEFLVQAEELANYRRGQGLNVLVVPLNQILNEFSGGLMDMRAMRDFFRFIYDKDSNPGDPAFKYALLFGDGHFDYRGIVASSSPNGGGNLLTNWIPTYQSDETFSEIRSYTSDDYFGLLDDLEGVWDFGGDSVSSSERVDIGIGRLPVQSASEASAIIAKIKRYEDPATFGAWRSRFTFVADDNIAGGADEQELHTQNADFVAQFIKSLDSSVNFNKVYAVSYPAVTTVVGRRVPDAKADVIRSFNDGSLIWNYSGHGGHDALADEKLIDVEGGDIESLTNIDTLPIVVTATCSFGHWDFVDKQSGAELMVLHPDGGAVAVFTTVRIVYTTWGTTSLNPGLNRELSRNLVGSEPDGRPLRLGDIMRLTKNSEAGSQGNNRKFNLLGDPSMRFGRPTREVTVETLNGQPLAGGDIPLKALEKVTLAGRVNSAEGTVDQAFSGILELTVFDASRQVPTVSNPRVLPTYEVQNDLIYRGRVQVNQGRFDLTFVVPKDISYSNQRGKISMYAWSDGIDGSGASNQILVGGTAGNPAVDVEGPTVELFLNDTTFVSGGLVPPGSDLIVRLFDENGLNTVGTGVGHELLLVIDNDESRAVDIGNRFEGELNSFQKGEIRYTLQDQEDGLHELRVKAWDVFNNATTASLDYFVLSDSDLRIRNVYNYPNPTIGSTRFVFEHNLTPGSEARVQIKVYTLSGRLVRVIDNEESLPGGILPASLVRIAWDGRDEDFDELPTGVYLYKLRVERETGQGARQVAEQIEKLAIIR